MPEWEIAGWKMLFEVFGELDWRRDDYRDARRYFWKSGGRGTLDDYLLYRRGDTALSEDEFLEYLEGDEGE